jgi:hypothetical protein
VACADATNQHRPIGGLSTAGGASDDRGVRIPFSPFVRGWLGVLTLVGAWLEQRYSGSAATWYSNLARAVLGASHDGFGEELSRGHRWVRAEVALLAAAGVALVASAVVSLLL